MRAVHRWTSLPLTGLLVLAADAAAQEGWPAKGDSVHIAASFKDLSAPSGVPNVRTRYDMPACVALRVAKAKPAKNRWTIEDKMGGKLDLEGPWASRMHKEKMECEAQLEKEGEPAVSHEGGRYILAPAKKPPSGDQKPK